MSDQFRSAETSPREGRLIVTAILGRAVRRGDMAKRDWSLITDALTAMGLMRVSSGLSVDVL